LPQTLTPDLADRFAAIALGHVTREYPNKLDHVLGGDADAQTPRALHPVFYGSFDWHSCVHGYWLLASVLRLYPHGREAGAIRALFDAHLTPERMAGELAYLARPASAGFERPYGWAWLLKLQAELSAHDSEEGRGWAGALAPLAEAFAERFRVFLPKAAYPVRNGSHASTAFAAILALDYAEVVDPALAALIKAKAADWYGADADARAWEPSGDDFLSPALVEAACMKRVLGSNAFPGWFDRFLPGLAARDPATLFTPAAVSDRADGKIAHLDGLNLSRAWCWRLLAEDHAETALMLDAADTHLAAGLPHVAGDYMGEHWLASFALLALTA
jgi:hypothetical protein